MTRDQSGAALFPRNRPFTRQTLGRIFGVSRIVLARWERIGAIRPNAVQPGRRPAYTYTWSQAVQFALDPATWHLWDLEMLADGELYRMARRKRGRVAWMTAAVAASRLGYSKIRIEQVARFDLLGDLAQMRDGHWYFRADRIDDLAEHMRALSAKQKRATYTTDDRVTIRRLRAEGKGWETIARAFGRRCIAGVRAAARLAA